MKKIAARIAYAFLAVSAIFLAKYLIISGDAIIKVEKPGQYLLWSLACLVFFVIAILYLFKYIRDKDYETLSSIEVSAGILQFVSLILLLAGTFNGFGELLIFLSYFGYFLVLLGGFEYYRTKKYLCISFVSWGVFLLLCANTFIYGV